MNIQHMRYAVAIADAGSINKASEDLLIAQPNLSRSVKELEADLGIRIFERSSRGMTLTQDGVQFISRAKMILQQINDLEKQYTIQQKDQKHFSVSCPRSAYISGAFALFSARVTDNTYTLTLTEEHSSETIQRVCSENYDVGIIRYEEYYDRYFKELFEEKDLAYELVAEFRQGILVNNNSPLAALSEVTAQDLLPYTEIRRRTVNDTVGVDIPNRSEASVPTCRNIVLSDRATALDVIMHNPTAFIWSTPQPSVVEEKLGLKVVPFNGLAPMYRDVLIHRKKHRLSEMDKLFMTALIESKRLYFS